MDNKSYYQNKKEIYLHVLDYLEDLSDSNEKFQELTKLLIEQNIIENEIEDLLYLISKIEENYHRSPQLYDKLEQLLRYLIIDKQAPISGSDIYQIFENNKKILFLLIYKKIITVDEDIIRLINTKKDAGGFKHSYYLYPLIKTIIGKRKRKRILYNITHKMNEKIDSLNEQKLFQGQNGSYICSLIRQDSIEEFVSYVNQTNLSLDCEIPKSLIETNSFLLSKKPTIIEYAIFYGSIQIIRYLLNNDVGINESMWLYGVHSNNPEVIQIIEENLEFEPNRQTMIDCLKESIKCHHNKIADYIIDNYLSSANQQFNEYYLVSREIIISSNFSFLLDERIKTNIFNTNIDSQTKISPLFRRIIIPSTINVIKKSLFSYNRVVKEFVIPTSVTLIDDEAFESCSSLIKINIPSSVTSIGNNAFKGCSSLTKLIIPSSVKSIGNCAFMICTSLTEIIIPSSVINIGEIAFNQCFSLKEVTIPNSVTEIKNLTFSECTSLKITIPDSVTLIGDSAFRSCTSLTEITIPSSVNSIGSGAFESCCSLEKVTILSTSIKSLNCKLFIYCHKLEHFTIPSSVTVIQAYAFNNCFSLKQITIPSSVTKIECNAFNRCKSLEQVLFTDPSHLEFIGTHAFDCCVSLKQITIPPSVTKIEEFAFAHCLNLVQVNLSGTLNDPENRIFAGCTSVTTISNI